MACGCEGKKCKLVEWDKRHGHQNGYNAGCRCPLCVEGHRVIAAIRYYEDPQRQKESSRRWQAANPEKAREIACRGTHLRRARKVSATIGPDFTRQQVWDRDNGTCHICKQPADPGSWHMDHVVPLAREGAHSFDNCAVSHPRCNLSKGARLLDELHTA